MFRIIIVFITVLFFVNSSAQTIIKAEQSDYKNETLVFYAYLDYITNTIDTIAVVETDQKGGFHSEFIVNSTRQIFVDLGVYHCSFYIEKARVVYSLLLPDKRLKTKVEELNIYFEPLIVRLGIEKNPNRDLNNLIASFDDIYDEFLSQNFDTIYKYRNGAIIDTFESKINDFYSEIQNSFFTDYKNYKIYELRFLGPNRGYEVLTSKYFNKKNIAYNNSSYMNLFNLMYKDFFNYYVNTKDGENIQNVIQEGRSIQKLIKTIDRSDALSDPFLEELIALKGINDEIFNPRMFNQVYFPSVQMSIILDSIANFSSIAEHRNIAINILNKSKSSSKIINKEAPNFHLQSIKDSLISLKNFRGKYVYLNFMRTDVVPAMESMDRLINFYKYHKEDIEVVSIFTDEDSIDFFKLDTVKYKWPLLYIGNNKELKDHYKLVTWPQFHLISPEGKLLISPARSLKEDFEVKFFEYIDKRRN